MDTASTDLISSLPDHLVGHILSFLSTKDAALTSVLSKRWRYLLAFEPNLDLDDSIYDHTQMARRRRKQQLRTSFKAFVDRVMDLQGNASLNKFSLKSVKGRVHRVNVLILNVLKRGVVDLDLYISWKCNYHLPSKVFKSKTLVKLKLGGKNMFIVVVGEFFLPKLKTLHLDDVSFSGEGGAAFAKLISGCHMLEELVMTKITCYRWESCSVSNPTLKRVTISCRSSVYNPKSVSFDTPNLVYLEFSDTVAVKYPKVNFDSLVEASLDLYMTPKQYCEARGFSFSNEEDRDMVGNAADFLMGMSNVKILCLSCETLEVLNFYCKGLRVFNNLIQLTIKTCQVVGWESFLNLLKNCPHLETLILEGLHYRDKKQCEDERFRFKDTNECWNMGVERCVCKPWEGTPICLSSSPVKILKVLKFGETSSYRDDMVKQIYLIKYFLETMPNLEQVILYYDTTIDGDLNKLSSELQMLEKVASTKCKIEVISDNISFSFTVGSSSSES